MKTREENIIPLAPEECFAIGVNATCPGMSSFPEIVGLYSETSIAEDLFL